MNSNLYKLTIEHLEDSKGSSIESAPLVFKTRNHEDIIKIAEMMKGKIDLDEEDVKSFAVGLKLFSGVMLKNKDNKLFKEFMPHFRNFMMELKKSKEVTL